jgi:hypothetical protein
MGNQKQGKKAVQLKYAAKASNNLGLNAHATFSGSLLGSISILGHNDQLV